MGIRIARCSFLAVVMTLAVACNQDTEATSAPTSATPSPATPSTPPPTRPSATCATPGVTAPAGCWQEILPLGSGGFPAAPGSQNTPVWEPGKFPLTLRPRLAFDDELWMTAQTLAYSSPDGLTWTQHDKTDLGERIYHSIVYFKGKLWMYGGMDYDARRVPQRHLVVVGRHDVGRRPAPPPGASAAARRWSSSTTSSGSSAAPTTSRRTVPPTDSSTMCGCPTMASRGHR